MGVHLLLAHHALLHEFGHQRKILDVLRNGVVIVHPRLDGRYAAQLFARLIRVVPEIRHLGLLLFVEQVDALLFDVQTALQRTSALFQILYLICKYHRQSINKKNAATQGFTPSLRSTNSSTKPVVPSIPSTDESMQRS